MTAFGATFERKQKVSSLKMYIHTFSSESLVAAPWLKSCTEESLQQDKTSCSIHQASHPGASAHRSRRSQPFRVKTSLEFICEQGWDRLCQGMLREAQLQPLLAGIPRGFAVPIQGWHRITGSDLWLIPNLSPRAEH